MKHSLFTISLLMLLTSVSTAGPGSLAKAEESTPKETIPGYITNNLIDSNNTVDETYDNEGSSKGTLIEDKFAQVDATAFDVTEVSTALLGVLNENSNESFGTTITGTGSGMSPYQRTDTYMQNTFYNYFIQDVVKSSGFPNKHLKVAKTFATFKLQCNYFISDWSSEEQPIEFIIDNNYVSLAKFCELYLDKSVEIPLIRINGQTICNLNYDAENKSSSIAGVNARVYPGINSEGYPSGKLFCEIPFMEFIETIEITGTYDITSTINDDNTLSASGDIDPNTQYYLKNYLYSFYNADLVSWLKFSSDVKNNASFSPILIDDLDLENASLRIVSPVGKTNRYIVDSIYLEDNANNEVEVKASIVPDAPLDLINKDTDAWRKALTDKFQKYDLTLNDKPFNYANDNAFIKKIKDSDDDFEFKVTNIKYHIASGTDIPSTAVDINDLKNSLDPSKLLDDETTKTIVKRPKMIKVSAKDIDYHGGGNGSWTIEREDGTSKTYEEGDELEQQDVNLKSIVVDMGNFYAFKVIKKEQIHVSSFPAIASQSIFGSTLRFDVYDNCVNERVSSINAIYFSYKFNNTSYGLSILSDTAVGQIFGVKVLDIIVTCPVFDIIKWANEIVKTDTMGNTFTLRAQTIPDRVAGLFSGFSKDFIVATNGNVAFDSIYSVVYYDKAGSVVQAVSRMNDNKGCTAVIRGDTIVIIGNDGEVLDDYYIDKNGIPRTPDGKERTGDQTSKGYDLLALLGDLFTGASNLISKGFGIIIAVLIIYLIIKLLPDIVEFFKKLGKK
ncbi:MAG: hypothetical protein MR766_03695 [Erysipelotrichaceae bacterium]|nr:hypothetical protein [Erysipelotrichaceae bacterium]